MIGFLALLSLMDRASFSICCPQVTGFLFPSLMSPMLLAICGFLEHLWWFMSQNQRVWSGGTTITIVLILHIHLSLPFPIAYSMLYFFHLVVFSFSANTWWCISMGDLLYPGKICSTENLKFSAFTCSTCVGDATATFFFLWVSNIT